MYLYTYTSYINVQPLKQKDMKEKSAKDELANIWPSIDLSDFCPLETRAYRKEIMEIQGKLIPFIHIRHKGLEFSFDIDPKIYEKLIRQTIRVTAKRHEHIINNIHYIVNKYDVTIL